MSEEKKESRINIEDLPQAEQELTSEESREVKGGTTGEGKLLGNLLTDKVVGGGAGAGPRVQGKPIMGDDDLVPL